ncbi:hypothetical protein SDC9_119308 [bioreactor metagenome]|uniref:Uncharacterized protein n=1 Tax=bioreactor metagenome TaxID=1076179 RepID=A0A645C466_9ZZZZ
MVGGREQVQGGGDHLPGAAGRKDRGKAEGCGGHGGCAQGVEFQTRHSDHGDLVAGDNGNAAQHQNAGLRVRQGIEDNGVQGLGGAALHHKVAGGKADGTVYRAVFGEGGHRDRFGGFAGEQGGGGDGEGHYNGCQQQEGHGAPQEFRMLQRKNLLVNGPIWV